MILHYGDCTSYYMIARGVRRVQPVHVLIMGEGTRGMCAICSAGDDDHRLLWRSVRGCRHRDWVPASRPVTRDTSGLIGL